MKISAFKTIWSVCLILITLCAFGLGIALFKTDYAYADVDTAYSGSYRNKFAYSAKAGWNNDPNGLLYVNGTYHMYYQYTWDQRETDPAEQTKPWWDHMSWGHATSTDLVHWTEKPVAIPAYQTVDGEYYAMMFSGSAVYDENNTSGIFDTDPETGKVVEGQGIVAILTQPNDEKGGQRQILAYSKDGGDSFNIYGEVLGAKDDGGIGDNEFRDPKVFWNQALNKWLMYVGGGSVRAYSSTNLKNWEYVGQTGFWGECPDISRFEVEGEEKYVLVISPEDKAKSHEYNGTNRADTYYPAEYYTVGKLNEKGLFVADQPSKRLSGGIDSYAFQSFNNSPDGKVYGVSWAASWKSVGEYEKFRKDYNGGMTVVCELNLIKDSGGYSLTRKPVAGYDELRGEKIAEYNDILTAGKNALAGVSADVADIVAELDFSNSTATCAELNLRVSAAERITLRYEVSEQTLILDRSGSSLLAENTALYKVPYKQEAPLHSGKLSLRILLDRAFVSVFANGGSASFFSAVFPSAISNGMQLVSDGDLSVSATVYAVESIFGDVQTVDELLLTTNKIDTTVGETKAVIASSYAQNFNADDVTFTVEEGSEFISLTRSGATAYVTALKKGASKIKVQYGGNTQIIEVYVYNNGLQSNVEYGVQLGGFSYIGDDGLILATGTSDAFLFSKMQGENFVYSATFTPKNSGAQAGGLVFGLSENLTNYWVATADLKDNRIKLWKSGIGDLKTVYLDLADNSPVKLTLAVSGSVANIYVNGSSVAALTYQLEDYCGGAVGLNVYNAEMAISPIHFKNVVAGDNLFDIGADKVVKVVNVTDGSYRLKDGDYTVENGKLSINKSYLTTLENGTEYVFRIITTTKEYEVRVTPDFASSAVTPLKDSYARGEELTLSVSGGVEVYKVFVNGKECEFGQSNGVVTVSSDYIKDLAGGNHTVKVYTANGRPQTEFTLKVKADFRDQDTEAVTYTFLYIDVAVFAVLIVGYIVFSIVLKRKSK